MTTAIAATDPPAGDDELRDGEIWRETRCYAEPFQAPAWRAQWVERIQEAAAPGVAG